jgi:hypothetical protein
LAEEEEEDDEDEKEEDDCKTGPPHLPPAIAANFLK